MVSVSCILESKRHAETQSLPAEEIPGSYSLIARRLIHARLMLTLPLPLQNRSA